MILASHCTIQSSTMRRNSNEKYICIYFSYKVVTTTNRDCFYHRDQGTGKRKRIEKSTEGEKRYTSSYIQVSERKRLHNKIDLLLQEYFEWLVQIGKNISHKNIISHPSHPLGQMVSETTSNSRFEKSLEQPGGWCYPTQNDQLTTRKSSQFFCRVSKSEFRTQPVATAVSATVCVDTTPTCTRADAHFSRAQTKLTCQEHVPERIIEQIIEVQVPLPILEKTVEEKKLVPNEHTKSRFSQAVVHQEGCRRSRDDADTSPTVQVEIRRSSQDTMRAEINSNDFGGFWN